MREHLKPEDPGGKPPEQKSDVLIPDPAQDGTRSLGSSCRPHPRPCYTHALGIKETTDKGKNRCQPGSQS